MSRAWVGRSLRRREDDRLLRGRGRFVADVARQAGAGWEPTWPQDTAVPPFARIDHVLVRGFATVAAGTVHVDGTDHAAVWGTVR